MKRETSGSYPAVDLPDLHIIFSWKMSPGHRSLESCMPLYMSPTFLFPYFLYFWAYVYIIIRRYAGKSRLSDQLTTVSVSVYHHLFFHINRLHVSSSDSTPFLLVFHLLFLFNTFSFLSISPLSFPFCSFVNPLLLIFKSPLVSCPALFSSML